MPAHQIRPRHRVALITPTSAPNRPPDTTETSSCPHCTTRTSRRNSRPRFPPGPIVQFENVPVPPTVSTLIDSVVPEYDVHAPSMYALSTTRRSSAFRTTFWRRVQLADRVGDGRCDRRGQ